MRIYVVTHERVELDLPEDYVLFQVGAANGEVFCENNDAAGGDCISEKNPNYCELTAAYWIWKNDKSHDIVGLMHYRRFLTTHPFSTSPKYFIGRAKAEKLLGRYDFIAPPLFKNKPDVKTIMYDGVHERDHDIMREAVAKLYPDCLETFDGVFSGTRTYFCNIFIARKTEWDAYYAWLFPIFDEMEKHVDMSGYTSRERRLYGFLSERLFTVYVRRYHKRVKSMRLIYPHKKFWEKVKGKLKKIFGGNRQNG